MSGTFVGRGNPKNQSSTKLIRVGVIGLGRLWETRHRPALARLKERFRVTAVYDQVAARAQTEAQTFGASVSLGLKALIDRPDVDVLYLVAPQWFGLHALELAERSGKPIYCALPLAQDLEGFLAIGERIRSKGQVFMLELARRYYPATLRLRELLATRLGRPRLILGHNRVYGYDRYAEPGPATQTSHVPLPVDPGAYLVDWCRFVFNAEPVAVQGLSTVAVAESAANRPPEPSDFETFVAEFAGGALAQVSLARYHHATWGEAHRFLPPPGFQVFAERGAAWLELPDRIVWTESGGQTQDERLPFEPPIGEFLNEQFHRLVLGEPAFAPTVDDALAMVGLLRDLRQSQREGRKLTPRSSSAR